MKTYSIGIILSIFLSAALIAVVEMPNIFENVLAQQLDESQEGSSEGIDRTSQHRSSEDLDRIPEDEPRSNPEKSSQQGQEDVLEDLD